MRRITLRELLRLKDGRELSAANRRAIRDVLDQHRAVVGSHEEMCGKLAAILDRTDPAKSDPSPDVAAPAIDLGVAADLRRAAIGELARFQAIKARRLGVAIGE